MSFSSGSSNGAVCCKRGLLAAIALVVWLEEPGQAQLPCEGLPPAERARCLAPSLGDAAKQAGRQADPGRLAPQYQGSNVPPTQYFGERGVNDQLGQDAQTAAQGNPAYQTLTNDTLNSLLRWDLRTSSPVATARDISRQFNAQVTTNECVEQTVCVDTQPGEATTAACEIPGVSRMTCAVTASATLTHQTFAEGGVDWQGPIGIENAVWVRLRQIESWLYALEVGNANNRATWCADNQVNSGVLWSTLLDFRSVVPATVANPGLQVYVETTGDGCGWGSYTFYGPTQFCRVLNCDAKGMQWPVIRYTYQVHGDVPVYQIADDCADVRSLESAVLNQDACLSDQPQPVTCQNGHAAIVPPPSEAPAAGCWQRQQEWVWQTQVPDTCEPYRGNPACQQTALTCVDPSPDGQECRRWEATYRCQGEPVCTRSETIRRCRSCGSPESPIPFCTETPDPSAQNIPDLFRTASYLQMLTEAKTDFDPDSLQLFRGTRRSCDYNTIGTVIQNCCADDPDQLFGDCPDEARQLADDRKGKRAHYVGTHCVQWFKFLFGKICIREEQVYCSFKSQLARMVEEQGRAQLGMGWGSADNPECRGFTTDELQRLNFASMDFSEWYTNVRVSINADAINQQFRQKLDDYRQQHGGG